MLNECLENLNIKSDGIYVDGTLGYAGISKEILKRMKRGFLFAFDPNVSCCKTLSLENGSHNFCSAGTNKACKTQYLTSVKSKVNILEMLAIGEALYAKKLLAGLKMLNIINL